MQATTAAALRVHLPVRSAVRAGRAAVRCQAQPRRAVQQHPAATAATALPLTLGSLLLASPALAEDAGAEIAAAATDAAAAATDAAGAAVGAAGAAATDAAAAAAAAADVFAPLGITPLGWGLIASPLLFYGGFNLYRTQVDPRAKFGDALFAFAASILLSNIVAIVVFKTRLF